MSQFLLIHFVLYIYNYVLGNIEEDRMRDVRYYLNKLEEK